MNITHRDQLLGDIADGLTALFSEAQRRRAPLDALCLEVRLTEGGDCLLVAPLDTALSYLANDIYWDEAGDWSAADHAEVVTL